MNDINQIHDVGKLVRAAVKAGWGYYTISNGPMVFVRGDRVLQINAIVRNWAELANHRKALGLSETTVEASDG